MIGPAPRLALMTKLYENGTVTGRIHEGPGVAFQSPLYRRPFVLLLTSNLGLILRDSGLGTPREQSRHFSVALRHNNFDSRDRWALFGYP